MEARTYRVRWMEVILRWASTWWVELRMPTRWSLGRQFLLWIAIGFFVIVVGPLWTKQSCLNPPPIGSLPSVLSHAPAFLCEEAKFTDLLLAYFTYCLVIVGWFTIRNSEKTVQNMERAFLSVGPTQITTLYRSGPTTPFIRMTLLVHNTGRTGATVTKIYGEFSRTRPAGDKPIYQHGKAEITDFSVAAGVEIDLAPFFFENDFVGQQFFWGYVEYLDIFKIKHTSRICAAIFPASTAGTSPGKFQLIEGTDAWRESD